MSVTEKFEEFWSEYPRHISKKVALARWMKLKVTPELFEKIMSSLKVQKKTKQWQNPEYIPHPSTWLNQERWNDEVIVPSEKKNNSKYDGI